MKPSSVAAAFFALLSLSLAQFPASPTGLTSVVSKVNRSVKISYKKTNICETTKGVKAYSGFVHLPGSVLSDIGGFDISTYFIYVEARHNAASAPLAVYLAGGAGESSTYAALSSESGPCFVNEAGNGTELNPWSFNNNANMLYIDQPVQAGFSYDGLVSALFNITDLAITPLEFNDSSAAAGSNPLNAWGTYPTQDPFGTTNTTVSSGKAVWHFAEHWLSSFPEYSTSSNKISFWGNSYGGLWAPEMATRFVTNFKSLPTSHPLQARHMKVDTLGVTNGCIDLDLGIVAYPEYAFNNTYDHPFLSEAEFNAVMDNITSPGGVADSIKTCRSLGLEGDPKFLGNNDTVNEACMIAAAQMFGVIGASEALNNRSGFDIAVQQPDPCPFYLSVSNYLNRADVQQRLGVPLNFTYVSNVVTAVFGLPGPITTLMGTGDMVRQDGLANLEFLLANGVKVALVYGDRDYRCPWNQGEMTAKATKWAHQDGFVSAGYTKIKGIKSGDQGVVKQFGLMSFSRIFDAGHSVSAYAPEAVSRIFDRAMLGKDIATGTQGAIGVGYQTKGPTDAWGWRNTLPVVPQTCMVAGKWTKTNPWASILALVGGQ